MVGGRWFFLVLGFFFFFKAGSPVTCVNVSTPIGVLLSDMTLRFPIISSPLSHLLYLIKSLMEFLHFVAAFLNVLIIW